MYTDIGKVSMNLLYKAAINYITSHLEKRASTKISIKYLLLRRLSLNIFILACETLKNHLQVLSLEPTSAGDIIGIMVMTLCMA